MISSIINLSGEDILLLVIPPNWAVQPQITLSWPTQIDQGRSGLERRSSLQSGFSVGLIYDWLETDVDFQAIRAAYGYVESKLVAVPLWPDPFTKGTSSDRLFKSEWVWNATAELAESEDSVTNGERCYPLLIGELAEAEVTGVSPRIGDNTLSVFQDTLPLYRLSAAAATPANWQWSPNRVYATQETITWTHQRSRLGRSQKSFVEGQDSTRRQQSGAFGFDRSQAASLIAFWASKRGPWSSFNAPSWITPGAETPQAPHSFDGNGGKGFCRFGSNDLTLQFAKPTWASSEIALQQEIESETPQALPSYAMLYELMRPLEYTDREIDVSSGSWWSTLATTSSDSPDSFGIPSPPCGTASVRQLTANTALNHHYVYWVGLTIPTPRMAVWVYVPSANTVVNGIRFSGPGAFPWPEGNIDWTDLPRDRWVLCELPPLTPSSSVIVIFTLSGSSKDFDGQNESIFFADFWAWPEGPRTLLTDWSEPIRAAGATWDAVNIQNDGIKRTLRVQDEKARFSVVLDEAPILLPIELGELASKVHCRLWQCNLEHSPPSIEMLYAGLVKHEKTVGKVATFQLSPFYGYLNRQLPHFHISRTCNYQFCDSNCGLSEANYRSTGEYAGQEAENEYVMLIHNLNWAATVPGGNPVDGYLSGGNMETGIGERKMTRSVRGSWWNAQAQGLSILIDVPLREDWIELGQVVTLVPDCDGNWSTCGSYGNKDNFGGAPWAPTYFQQAPMSTPKGGK